MKKILRLECELNISDLKAITNKPSNILLDNNIIPMTASTLSVLIDKLWSNTQHLGGLPHSNKLKLVILRLPSRSEEKLAAQRGGRENSYTLANTHTALGEP